ncbi:MAG: M23 family metallopeptidase [Anaerolineae bacterium]
MKKRLLFVLLFVIGLTLLALLLGGRYALNLWSNSQSNSLPYIESWFNDSASRAQLSNWRADGCPAAPFLLPSDGLIGLLWEDPAGPYTVLNPHTGLDIFGNGEPGTVPVYAAYEGYLTRLSDWLSTVIIRHDDPLQAGRVIWTYYTHMASRDGSQSFVAAAFPPGSEGVWVEQGTLLGYQGEYSGSGAPIGMHVHFSIVLSDADGSFANEARLANTIDPSPYFGMPLKTPDQPTRPIACE